MICRRCGKEVEKGWRFCPNCGSVTQRPAKSLFDEIFSRFRKEFSSMDSQFNRLDKEFEVLDLSPFIRQQRNPTLKRGQGGSGFTIKITRRNNEQPRVDVKTFGNVDNNALRKEVNEEMQSLGMKSSSNGPLPEPAKEPPRKRFSREFPGPARFTEEPKTSVRSLGTKLVVSMEMGDVKSEGDIEINELESSVEVRARAGDKAYFKIIKKPEHFSLKSRSFEKGRLSLEFS